MGVRNEKGGQRDGRARRMEGDMKRRKKDREGKGEWVFISQRHSEGNDGVGTREQKQRRGVMSLEEEFSKGLGPNQKTVFDSVFHFT